MSTVGVNTTNQKVVHDYPSVIHGTFQLHGLFYIVLPPNQHVRYMSVGPYVLADLFHFLSKFICTLKRVRISADFVSLSK